ncbi:MAG: restriction endonuclease [Methanofastidiosum sp.]|nr:restriction endonuclease [Methanofastidiosum sp.]
MPIPNFQTLMLPLLKLLKDKQEHTMKNIIENLSDQFNLTDEERRIPTSVWKKEPLISNRSYWARFYLKKAGLVESNKPGFVKITDRGLNTLDKNLPRIDTKYLYNFLEFRESQDRRKTDRVFVEEKGNIEDYTPDELIDKGMDIVNSNLSQELLSKLREGSPGFFEIVVLDLLEAMGYGKGQVTGKSGDGGIDGIIYQDKLGIDKIAFQAKRFNEKNYVSSSMIRDFAGSLLLKETNKGVFITTSYFPRDIEKNYSKHGINLILVDGDELAELMIEHNIGVSVEKAYSKKRIDTDYFIE